MSHLPELNLSFSEVKGAYNTAIEHTHIDRIYTSITSISIDNGLLRKSRQCVCITFRFWLE